MARAPLVLLQINSTRGPEWFGRCWRSARMILREAQSGLGVAGDSTCRFHTRPRAVWAPLVLPQTNSTRGPEWFGRCWRPARMILREAQSGLGAAGDSTCRFHTRPRVVWAPLVLLQINSTRGPEWFGRWWRPARMILREAQSGLGAPELLNTLSRHQNPGNQPAIFLYSFLLTSLL